MFELVRRIRGQKILRKLDRAGTLDASQSLSSQLHVAHSSRSEAVNRQSAQSAQLDAQLLRTCVPMSNYPSLPLC